MSLRQYLSVLMCWLAMMNVAHSETMAEMMDMDDNSNMSLVSFDRLEAYRISNAQHDSTAFAWSAHGWYGNDDNKLWIKTEGERAQGATHEARVEALWHRIVTPWWSMQTGVRHDFGQGPAREWIALGMAGLAPYWFAIDATLYAGEQGRAAARVEAEHELLLTQQWILQAQLETNFYGKDDAEKNIGAGFADIEAGLRLRYEIRREFAPYAGVTFVRRLGKSADMARAHGTDVGDMRFLIGLRTWF